MIAYSWVGMNSMTLYNQNQLKLIIMNAYGKKFGFHTPKLSELNKNLIESLTKVKFIDSSWHNDLCDSIASEELNIQIFLPNSDIEDFDRELFSTCSIVFYDGKTDYSPYEDKQFTVNEIVDIVNTINN